MTQVNLVTVACLLNLLLLVRLLRSTPAAEDADTGPEFTVVANNLPVRKSLLAELGAGTPPAVEAVLLYLSYGCPACATAIRQLPRWVPNATAMGVRVIVIVTPLGVSERAELTSTVRTLAPTAALRFLDHDTPGWTQLNSRGLTPAFVHVRSGIVESSGEYGSAAWQRLAHSVIARSSDSDGARSAS